ncbi:hypothetical protein GPUN_1678 [Glaciecola punicea ACAM 611]|uniref:Uncharacterized protein n=1 Tax=Glaciecola punicea ACAM 611 TaxID=1121923 RepID=H5TBW7_9ALTE|nr:hypothetical protein GPUN_1678 [Glaciecola punicea ACAM 611]
MTIEKQMDLGRMSGIQLTTVQWKALMLKSRPTRLPNAF